MNSTARSIIVSVFALIILLNAEESFLQQPDYPVNFNKKQYPTQETFKEYDFAALCGNFTETPAKHFNPKAENTVLKISVWKNVTKIAFSGKDLDSNLKEAKYIVFNEIIFRPPDISFPFNYFW